MISVKPMAWAPYMLRKFVGVNFHSFPDVGSRAEPLAYRGSRGIKKEVEKIRS
jgi:hypothetical protein